MKTILVPTDFSVTADNACEYAMELAKASGAGIILLHVFHVPVPATDMPVFLITPEELEIENRKRMDMMAEALRSKTPGVDVQIEIRAGFAVEEIMNLVKEMNPDLVVMGIHDMNAVDELLIGSTTTDVIERSKCPVLVVPHNIKFSKPAVIAFASDLKELPETCSLDILKELVHLFNAKVDVLTVIKPDETPTIEKAVAGIKLEHRLEDVDHTHHFPVNHNIQEGIQDYVEKFAPGMLVMLHRKHNFFQRLFSEGNTQKAAFHTHIPLLAMRA
jgi:nucleotide-binding universal stress UspA family protein